MNWPVGTKIWISKKTFERFGGYETAEIVHTHKETALEAARQGWDVYELEVTLTPTQLFDPEHDQEAACARCGHPYARHFDWMEDHRPGCKYCLCDTFVNKEETCQPSH